MSIEPWPTEAEIELEAQRRWAAAPAEQKLEFLEDFVSGLLAARAAGPKRPQERDKNRDEDCGQKDR